MRQYFKGCYFKCCSEGGRAFALIPAQHSDGRRHSASLQVITDEGVYMIPCSGMKFEKGKIKLGKSEFSAGGISLGVDSKDCRIHGRLRFRGHQKIRYDIMGPF